MLMPGESPSQAGYFSKGLAVVGRVAAVAPRIVAELLHKPAIGAEQPNNAAQGSMPTSRVV